MGHLRRPLRCQLGSVRGSLQSINNRRWRRWRWPAAGSAVHLRQHGHSEGGPIAAPGSPEPVWLVLAHLSLRRGGGLRLQDHAHLCRLYCGDLVAVVAGWCDDKKKIGFFSLTLGQSLSDISGW